MQQGTDWHAVWCDCLCCIAQLCVPSLRQCIQKRHLIRFEYSSSMHKSSAPLHSLQASHQAVVTLCLSASRCLSAAASADTKGSSTSVANTKKGDATANSNTKGASLAVGKDADAKTSTDSTSVANSKKGDATANSNSDSASKAAGDKGEHSNW